MLKSDGETKTCTACGVRTATRARGLCHPCYRDLPVRLATPPLSTNAHAHGEVDFVGQANLPDSPTDAQPGSEDKIQVMIRRAGLRQQLHHPRDAKIMAEAAVPVSTSRPRVVHLGQAGRNLRRINDPANDT